MFSEFSDEAQKVLLLAKKEMQQLRHPYVGSEHLLLAILNLKDCKITKILETYQLTYERFYKEIVSVIGIGKVDNSWFLYTPLLKRVIENAVVNCNDNNSIITVETLFLSLLEEGEGVANRILMGMNIDIDFLYEKISERFVLNHSKNKKNLFIEEYAVDFNKVCSAIGFDPVIGRDDSVNRLVEILLRRTKNNPLLIGDAGVGKTAVVEEFVRRVVAGSVPKKLMNRRVLCLTMASLVAGTKYRGEFDDRLNNIISELENDDSVILFIDEIHTLVGAGGAEGAIDASNILKPYLARGKIRIIGATTKEEYHKYIESDKALDRRFQKIYINELSSYDTENILFSLKSIYEDFHGVSVSNDIIKEIVRVCERYVSYGKFPDKAIDLFDEVCARTSLNDSYFDLELKRTASLIRKNKEERDSAIIDHNYKLASELRHRQTILESEFNNLVVNEKKCNIKKEVKLDSLYNVVYERTKVPVSYLKNINKEKLICDLSKNVLGQDDVIKKLVCSINFSPKNVPNSFLFVGKSGVGKTFLAKEWAKLLCSNDSFIVLDMSEYNNEFSCSKIIGVPPGYSGYNDNNTLVEKIKHNPYSVLLLDGIEKANVNVLRLFSRVLGDGALTNAMGDIIDFKNVTIFMTSSLAIKDDKIGFFKDKDKSIITESFKQMLGDEFVSRIGEILVFNDLDYEVLRKIIMKKISSIGISGDSEACNNFIDEVIEQCDFVNFGARNVNKVVDKKIESLSLINS